MSDSNPIQYEEIIDPSAFPTIIDSVEQLIAELTRAEVAMTKVMVASKGGLGGGIKTVEDVQQIQNLTNKTNELAAANTKTKSTIKELTIATAEAKLQMKETNAGIMEAAKNNLGLTSEYQKQSTILNELRNRYKDMALAGDTASAGAKKLHNDIVVLDTKLKQVDATVGQHQRNVGNYTNQVLKLGKGIGGVAGLLDIFGKAIGLDEEAIKAASEAHHIFTAGIRDMHHVIEGNEVALGEETVAVEANTVATEEQTVAQEASNAAWLASPIGIMVGVGVALAGVGVAIYELTKDTLDSAEAIHIFNAAMTEEEKQINKLSASILDNSIKNHVLKGDMTQAQADQLRINLDAMKQTDEATQFHLNFIADLNKEYDAKNLEEQKKQARNQNLGLAYSNEGFEMLEREKNKKLLAENDRYNRLKSTIQIDADGKSSELSNKAANESDKDLKKHSEKKVKTIKDNSDKENEARLKSLREQYERETDLTRKAELKAEEDEQRRLKSLREQYEHEMELQKKEDEKAAEEKKKAREKEIQDDEALAERLIQIVSDAEEKKTEAKIKENERQQEINQKAIDNNIALGVNANAEVLAAEMKHQDELEKQHEKELQNQKKMAERKEAIELGLAFIKAFNADLDRGKTGAQALADASMEVLAAKMLGKALSGSAFEGVEDTGNGGGLDNKNGSLWMLHPNERVIPKKLNDKLDGITNDELVNSALAFQNIYQPNFNDSILQDFSKREQVDNSMLSIVSQKLDGVKEAIENKPVPNLNIDNAGKLVKEMISKNNIQRVTKQTYLN